MIETTTKLLTSHQIFLKEAKGNATNFKLIRPKALKRWGSQNEQAKNEISGAKKTDHYQNIDFFEIE
ncbi:hypothetical protein JP0051_13690 [Helicobacter pylori]|nr:hypothetical protein JP0051_13690 [Helicobacter pylori]